ncbi:pyocin knob domain-containing protein [Fusobacterium sp.]|uniref:pyocin knob domain-containing protein n=1 Tax=Fusobacterium sp. TaxID=68766 RepID=UPI002E7AAEF4|nr:pyocin knob domain-containing protein [Fusobacterium sp.]MEE1477132.1 pyocin knob domain-containing protein [Fusobacterium sp.]
MSKIITDEQELNTAVDDLVTDDYALEILGLQNIADFRKFSRSFMKLSKIVKRIENSDNNKSEKGHLHDDRYYTEAEVNNELAKKLNKGAVSSDYDTAKKIEDKIKKIINEKWKINTKYIGDTNTSTDFNSITANGTYYSNKYNALYTNGFLGANQRAYQEFKLIVIGENNDGAPVLKSQLVITRDDNIYLRSCTSWQAPWTWSEWKKIARMSDVEEKFKNFCPFPVGSILQMWNETNPTSLYLGTTWELISAGKYVKTGERALQTGGSNSITLTKDNLPNTKVSIDTFSVTVSPHYHNEGHACWEDDPNAFGKDWTGEAGSLQFRETTKTLRYRTSTAGGGSTSTASPQTSALGKGTAITIQPEFITLKFWKRTS